MLGRNSAIVKSAFLPGYHRYKVLNEVYPAIFKRNDFGVHGSLLSDITNNDFESLDKFETGYDRIEVDVEITDGSNEKVTFKAYTYVWARNTTELYGTWEYETDFLPHINEFIASNS